MKDDLISRKSVLDYIENEISKAKSTETISYLRALSVHINEYEPTAYDVDKVVKQLEENAFDMDICEEQFDMNSPYFKHVWYKMLKLQEVLEIVKAGGKDDISISNKI